MSLSPDNPDESSAAEGALRRRPFGHQPALTALLVLAAFYTIYLTRTLLLPIVFAVLFSYLLSPIVRRLERWRIHPTVGAGIVLIVLVVVIAFLIRVTWEPLATFMVEMPEHIDELRRKVVDPLQQLMHVVSQTGEQIREMTRASDTISVVVEEEEITEYLFTLTPMFLGAVVSTLILLYFILAYKSVLFLRFIKVTPRLSDKKRAVEIFRTIENSISTYLLTIFVINSLLGLAVGVIVGVLGFPNPVFWGVVAALFNFIPYLGSMVGVLLMALNALVVYDNVAHALVFPAIYGLCSALEGNFITPMVHGRAFTINPVIIVLGLLFWGWLWGIPGALLAVPILVVFKVICAHLPSLESVNQLMGR